MPEQLLERALTAAEGIRDDGAKAKALGSLMERLPESLLERALMAAERIGDDQGKARVLGSLAERLPEQLLERALTAVERTRDNEAKTRALGALAERLPDERAHAFIVRVPDYLATMRRESGVTLLSKFAMHLDSPIALTISEAISDVHNRWR